MLEDRKALDNFINQIYHDITKLKIDDEILAILYKQTLERVEKDLSTLWFYYSALKARK